MRFPASPAARFGVRSVLAMVALAIVAVPFGLLLFSVLSRWTPLLSVDNGVRDQLHHYTVAHPAFLTAMKTMSTIGSARAYFPVFVVVTVWLLYRNRPRTAAFAVVTVTGSAALNALEKVAVQRARPTVPDPVATATGLSFPSGHAQSAVFTYATLLLLFWSAMRAVWRRVAVIIAALVVLGIGLSRVALSVHYVSDVLAGYVLGMAWGVAMTALFHAWRQELHHQGQVYLSGFSGRWRFRSPRTGWLDRRRTPSRSRPRAV